MKILLDANLLVSAAELGELIGADSETVNNWIRRDIVDRAHFGGRQLRHRLFSPEAVYTAALINELVKLRLPPSPASEAARDLWKELDKDGSLDGKKVYGAIWPDAEGWKVSVWWRHFSGGPLFKMKKRSSGKILEEAELPKQAFAVVPISDLFENVTAKLAKVKANVSEEKLTKQ
jgi:hypothetical protein